MDIVFNPFTGKFQYLQSSSAFGPSVSSTQTLDAGDTLAITDDIMRLQSSGGDITSTALKPLSDGTTDGEIVYLQGNSDTDRWRLPSASNVFLNGGVTFAFGKGDMMLLTWNADNSRWEEISRSANT